MPIRTYTGQPLAPGMIVLRRSIMTNGICSHPAVVEKVAGSRLYIRHPRDTTGDAKTVKASTVEFIADTLEEAMALMDANQTFLKAEQKLAEEASRARSERRRAVIDRFITL